jgi:hypothetical protein
MAAESEAMAQVLGITIKKMTSSTVRSSSSTGNNYGFIMEESPWQQYFAAGSTFQLAAQTSYLDAGALALAATFPYHLVQMGQSANAAVPPPRKLMILLGDSSW